MQPRFDAGMHDTHATIQLRDAARRRVLRTTRVVVVGSAALAGVIAAYLGGTPSRHKVAGATTTRATSPSKQETEVPVPATPAPPSLDSSERQQVQTPASQSAPIQAPSQAATPPVAVSGGS